MYVGTVQSQKNSKLKSTTYPSMRLMTYPDSLSCLISISSSIPSLCHVNHHPSITPRSKENPDSSSLPASDCPSFMPHHPYLADEAFPVDC